MEAYPDETVRFNFASSGKLMKQIEEGARVDVFASASKGEIGYLADKGLIKGPDTKVFAKNSLSLLSNNCPDRIYSLTRGDFKRIAIGNPATVPAGKYAKETLEHFGIYDTLKGKLVYAENARQILDHVIRGDACAGIVYKTDAVSVDDMALYCFDVDEGTHEEIEYIIAVTAGTRNKPLSKLFMEYLTSDAAVSALERRGFKTK